MSNKTSDNSVANIEENIKTIKNLLQMLENGFLTEEMCPIRSWDPTPKYASALKYILAEREQDKKRIQELEEERDHWHGCFIVAMENGIAKEKVKNVLKNNRNEIFSATYLSREQFRPYEMQIERINKIEQELIGEDK